MVISVGIGAVGGFLFHIFLGDGDGSDSDRLFVALAGGIILVSGASAYLHLSPVLAGMFFGITLVNSTRQSEALIATLGRVERPFYFMLLFFGGVAWQPSQRAWVAPVLLFLAVRALGKIGGARLGARMNGALDVLGGHWGRALLGQGRVALAIGLSYLRQEELPFRNTVFTATVASILLSEFMSARLARSVLTSTGSHRIPVPVVDGDTPESREMVASSTASIR